MKTLYYRGLLRSCNYRCGYCPFSGRRLPNDEEADAAALLRFCRYVSKMDAESVMLVPYGEAMVHPYYWEGIEALCTQPNIRRVGCQTNLSFDIEGFIARIASYRKKIRLWCSFHPGQVTLEDFLTQCNLLWKNGVAFSVGAVGDPRHLETLQWLKVKLPKHIYFWINALKGYRYAPMDRQAFLDIDPLFTLETSNFPADMALCSAGRESLFVEGDGSAYACPISRVRLGNIYKDIPLHTENICRAAACNCYLAYVNREDAEALSLFGEERVFRINGSLGTIVI